MARSSAAESCGSDSVWGWTIRMTASVPQTRSFTNPTACCRYSSGSVLPTPTGPKAGRRRGTEERLPAIGWVESGDECPGEHPGDGPPILRMPGRPAVAAPNARRSPGSTPDEAARRRARPRGGGGMRLAGAIRAGSRAASACGSSGRIVDHRPRQGFGLKRQLPVQIGARHDQHWRRPSELRGHRLHVQRMVPPLAFGCSGSAEPQRSPRGSPGSRSGESRPRPGVG